MILEVELNLINSGPNSSILRVELEWLDSFTQGGMDYLKGCEPLPLISIVFVNF